MMNSVYRLALALLAAACLGAAQQPSPWIEPLPEEVRGLQPPEAADDGDEGARESAMEHLAPQSDPSNYGTQSQQLYAPGYLRLFNAQTSERYSFAFRGGNGAYDMPVLNYFDWFLRCHRDGDRYIRMDWRVIEYLNLISYYLGYPEIIITSGYRTPRYNGWLRASGVGAAENSLHMRGQAIDFMVPGRRLDDVWRVAYYARQQLGFGGLGYYPRSNFIHIDSGPFRTW